MPTCKKCNKPAVNDTVLCVTCNGLFHTSCSRRYILSQGASRCCITAFSRARVSRPSDNANDIGALSLAGAATIDLGADSSSLPGTPLFTFPPPVNVCVSTSTDTPTITDTVSLSLSAPAALSSTAAGPGGELLSLPHAPLGSLSAAQDKCVTGDNINAAVPLATILQHMSTCIAAEFSKLQSAQQQQFATFEKQQHERYTLLQEENARNISALNKRMDDLLHITNRLDDHDANFLKVDSRMNEFDNKLTRALQCDSRGSGDSGASAAPMVVRDTAELLISGIPAATNLSPVDITHKVLSALGLANLTGDVLSADFFPRVRAAGPSTATNSANSSTGATHTHTSAGSTVIVMFKAPNTRDFVVSTRLKKKSFTTVDVLGCGTSSALSIRPLYPKQTFELLKLARQKSSELGYKHPRVINFVVHVRKDLSTPFHPVLSPGDLDNLEPAA